MLSGWFTGAASRWPIPWWVIQCCSQMPCAHVSHAGLSADGLHLGQAHSIMWQYVTVHVMMTSNVVPNAPESNLWAILFTLPERDVKWLIYWGCFKMAYFLVSHPVLFPNALYPCESCRAVLRWPIPQVLDFWLRFGYKRELAQYKAIAMQSHDSMFQLRMWHHCLCMFRCQTCTSVSAVTEQCTWLCNAVPWTHASAQQALVWDITVCDIILCDMVICACSGARFPTPSWQRQRANTVRRLRNAVLWTHAFNQSHSPSHSTGRGAVVSA